MSDKHTEFITRVNKCIASMDETLKGLEVANKKADELLQEVDDIIAKPRFGIPQPTEEIERINKELSKPSLWQKIRGWLSQSA